MRTKGKKRENKSRIVEEKERARGRNLGETEEEEDGRMEEEKREAE